MFERWYAGRLIEKLQRPYIHLMFGARQTGKSTLINALLPPDTLRVDLSHPGERSRYSIRPDDLIKECRAMPQGHHSRFVFIDEVQFVPALLDAIQYLYDSDKNRWRFILCGSSARKLRRSGTNLLPGRSFLHRLYPLILCEHPAPQIKNPEIASPAPVTWKISPAKAFPAWELEPRLAFGALPGIVAGDDQDRQEILKAYAVLHLQEEIRREALVKDWGAFLRFLEMAAIESGQMLNYANISRESGVSVPTIKNYYQLLEDIFIGFFVPAYSKSQRKNLLSTPKFFFFDLGVRHAAAGIDPSIATVRANPGPLFEQWVGIELWKRLQYTGDGNLYYQRTRDGAEVDFIVEQGSSLLPIEVKWTEHPSLQDARHLMTFLKEHHKNAERAYIICRCALPMQLNEKVMALPWHCL
jgi:uncharacterized protein